MSKVNILLVDDQPGKLLSYQTILAGLGENLVTAASGKQALQCLLRDDFALILLDVVMPEMDGFETAALIRGHPRLERTPIIFLTAFSPSEMDRLKGYELGAVDFVFAPIVPEILRAKVSALVELYRNRRELARANERLIAEIAERKRAQELALKGERLAAVGQMVAGLAHESRNALQQIQASIEMLARRLKSSSENSLILEIQKAHDRIVRLLDEVRSYAGPMKLAREIHDVAPLWQEAWKQLSARRLGREASLHSITNGVDLRCLVDPFPIETVFRNIFEHSLANCRDPVRIVVSCSESELEGQSALRIRIQDNGVGLSPEQRSRMFEPFFITRTNGSGLGMAIAKRIVEAHEGTIKIGDEPGTGTTIEIHLPRG